ncbi:D-beta-hydroxybutyrate dehydrogenase, mitochondrial [Dendroctonus ponderosae]|uniref:D-beta-hydroxybutyrate dehydrogenase, mitochondrial n=1 Tax=Dendroctonus ponderosae TaxID=77166 RepID=U4UL40_DENPD|nr:D-beta-hydroxybutyrate dehydrogenase, mitochondrial [Dendroctonus ponderosae]XP_019755847.2 D-beta-hydroxybutyrate dehydrogenase, mitochondrial [Dendroctonus ponderosae]XP_048526028.1 D-beta-hydroxybutyrate dehydrogenase, mitochondrial [Dendroctonus ponderosae]ERL93822.1 hypothetical protein D910_11108 [Dendroctonus ponderosae]KAH1026624.1 hypothetical protein HUJ05_000262 [Dendroctonus ponderosae]KAH1026625.1 hypothetical protein HUJ05_000262 [Dendroctonus ponderosae]
MEFIVSIAILQLGLLLFIAAALLLYLICRIPSDEDHGRSGSSPGSGKTVLVTSCDCAIGLQLAFHLANSGFRVFAGLKTASEAGCPEDSVPAKAIRAWQKYRESEQELGNITVIHLDVTREDLLYESVDVIRAHLPAGQDGIWAVVCTNGITFRGSLAQQEISHWDTILKTNIVGVLRTARTFQNLLKNSGGRILTIGTSDNMGGGLVAYAASRYGVEGASDALRQELSPYGIKVVTINPVGIMPELLFAQPKFIKNPETDDVCITINGLLNYQPRVLTERALDILDIALIAKEPKSHYKLKCTYKWWHRLPLMSYI